MLLLLLFISAYFYALNPHCPLKNFPRVFTSLSSTLHPFFWVKWPYLHLYYPYLSIMYPTSLSCTHTIVLHSVIQAPIACSFPKGTQFIRNHSAFRKPVSSDSVCTKQDILPPNAVVVRHLKI